MPSLFYLIKITLWKKMQFDFSGLTRDRAVMVKVLFNTFGCKTNQYDSALLGQSLERSGFELTGKLEQADWVVVNTCSVTKRGEDKACQWVRKVGREFPGVGIAVVGCSVEVSAGRFRELEGVGLLLGTEEKFRLGEVLRERLERINGSGPALEEQRGRIGLTGKYEGREILSAHAERARAFVKIQDGCDNRCTYCIVPYARGRSRSRPWEQIVAEARALEEAGHYEAVLTGIHIGGYGRDLAGRPSLSVLVEKVLAATDRIRLRLSSVEATEVDSRLIELLSRELRLCRHLHLPLQHGSASVLARMGRKYNPEEYKAALDRVLDSLGHPGLGTDVIAGFPGESEKEFEECFNFIAALPFTYLHVFPYSPRPGTPAALLAGRPPEAAVRERVRRMRELSKKKQENFLKEQLGSRLSVLHESRLSSGVSVCRADNYVRAYHRGASPAGGFILVAERTWRDGVWGRLEC